MTDSRHLLGQDVGGYVLERPLGKGASATVYLARNIEGNQVALKLLSPDIFLGERRHEDELPGRQRLRAEAAALTKLDVPGVAHVLDLEIDSDVAAFLVTEYIAGSTLEEDVRRGGAWRREDVYELGTLLAKTLQAVHARGVCHRDIKPANVILGTNGPILIDFGIAFATGEAHLTQTGLVVGTPGFISPEVICGNPPSYVDDWWSLGATLLFALTGKPPFGAESQTVQISRVLAGNPAVETLDVDLATVFRDALAPQESRSADFNAILKALAVPLQISLQDKGGCTERYNIESPTTVLTPAVEISPIPSSTELSWQLEASPERGEEEETAPDSKLIPLLESESPLENEDSETLSVFTPRRLPFLVLAGIVSWALLGTREELIAGVAAPLILWLFAAAGWQTRAKHKLFSVPTALVKGLFTALPSAFVIGFFLGGSLAIKTGLFPHFPGINTAILGFSGLSIPQTMVLRLGMLAIGGALTWWLPSSAPARTGARIVLRRFFPQWGTRFLVGVVLLSAAFFVVVRA
ncbi:serine/threonine protein kinase [Mobiluncus mulieris]|uniref:non-specific serine/threonine protein kinase n=1 Tax=Mobiluncus mulieris TaxID=2052 RepID=A0A8G2HSK6_9ACTO|nr:serine/threonine-protein kinase [Mobiluncus mulieris]MBB5847392.1 serine/threonine protein kinase [Mobiluncus mulieris]STO16163.1 Serine/threonine-protein kinase AfsK [Mobiluncus mulieris]